MRIHVAGLFSQEIKSHMDMSHPCDVISMLKCYAYHGCKPATRFASKDASRYP